MRLLGCLLRCLRICTAAAALVLRLSMAAAWPSLQPGAAARSLQQLGGALWAQRQAAAAALVLRLSMAAAWPSLQPGAAARSLQQLGGALWAQRQAAAAALVLRLSMAAAWQLGAAAPSLQHLRGVR